MKKSLYFSFIFLCAAYALSSQVTTVNHTAINIIGDIEFYENKAYVANRGGLLVIDLDTDEDELLVPANSGLKSSGTSEVEILSNGDMWISGYRDGGLYFYDGSEFEHFYYLDNGDSIRGLTNLLADDEQLWFTSNIIGNGWYGNGKLYSHVDGEFTDHSFQFPNGVSQYCFDENNELWVAYEGNLYRNVDGSFMSELSMPAYNNERDLVTDYHIDKQGVHWIGFYDYDDSEYSIWKYSDQIWTSYSTECIRKILETDQGEIIFIMTDVLGSIKNGQVIIDSTHHLYPEIPYTFSSPAVLRYEEGEVWLSTFHGYDDYQLYRVKDGQTKGYGKNEGYLGSLPSSITKDCTGRLYTNTLRSVQRYREEVWFTYRPEYKSSCSIRRLTTNPYTCEIWGYFIPSGECMSLWKIGEEEILEIDIVPDACWSMSFDRHGSVYVNASLKILKIDSIGVTTEITNPDMRWSLYSFVSSKDELWTVGPDLNYIDRLWRLKDGVWTTFSQDNTPLSENIASWSFEDSQGNMWFKNDEGLVSYDGQNWTEYPLEFIGDIEVSDIVEDNQGYFWISTYGKGIFYWNGLDHIQFTNENTNLLSDNCYQLELVNNDNLWVLHPYGLTEIKLNGVSSTQPLPSAIPKPQFTLYPNPSSATFHVKNESVADRRYEVYNIEGEHILSETSDQEVWSSTLGPGIYFVKVVSKDGEAVEKLLVTK